MSAVRPLCGSLAVAFATIAWGSPAFGQHDAERNAVQDVAAKRFDKADAGLEKGQSGEAETNFVRMLSALGQGKTEAAAKFAQAALEAGLPPGRLLAGPREALAPLYETDAFREFAKAHASLVLLHGPMVGTVTDRSAAFWMRTARPGTVQVKVYAPDGGRPVAASDAAQTAAGSDYTAVVKVAGLSPGTEYRYDVLVDGKVVPVENAKFRSFPEQGRPAKFSVGFGGGAGFVPMWEHMWDVVLRERPLAFLMLGDNVYIDDPTHSLTQRYCYYRRQSRPEWRRLVASTGMYSIYDDHDFGTNDCIPGPEIETPPWKRQVWNVFRQNWVNPAYGGGEDRPGCWYDFHVGDVHFVLLDGRYYRSREGTPSMLGPVQKKWLLETLAKSRGTFKVLASPVPWSPGIKGGSNDPWDGFPEEREEIFSFLEKHRIDGVILVAADRHRTDLRVTRRPGGYDLYEFESSKLTNRHTHGVVDTPGLIWGHSRTCSFALMRFDTARPDPLVTFDAITIDGEKVHTFDLPLSRLRHAAK